MERNGYYTNARLLIIQFFLLLVLSCFYTLAHADCDSDGDNADPNDVYGIECNSPVPPNPDPPPAPPKPQPPVPPDPCKNGDPVDCYSGTFMHTRVDMIVADVTPLQVMRVYRSNDLTQGAFGIGTSMSYDISIVSDGDTLVPASKLYLALPDSERISYDLIGDSTATTTGSATYVAEGTVSGKYGGSVIYKNSSRWSLVLKDGSKMLFGTYDGNNYRTADLIESSDRNGNITNYLRDSLGNLTEITSPNLRHLFFKYDTSNRIYEIDDDIGRKTMYQYYTTTGELESVTDPLGHTESYTYDAYHNMLTVKDKRGNVMVKNTYDPATRRVSKQTYALGTPVEASSTFSYTLDGNGNTTQTDYTNERGSTKRLVFNSTGQVVKRIEGLGSSAQQTYSFTLDNNTHQILSETDPLGHITTYEYDASGNIVKKTVMYGTSKAATWRYTYDPDFSQLTSFTDPMGHTTTYTLDDKGNVQQAKDPLSHTVDYTYDSEGRMTTMSRNTGTQTLTTRLSYDGADLLSAMSPKSETSYLFHDAVGRLVDLQDANGNVTTYSYDDMDRLTRECDPLGNCSGYQYDENGNLTQFLRGTASQLDQGQGVTERDFTYDARNRVSTKGRGSNVELTFAYDPAGALKTRTEASGRIENVTQFDALGNPLHIDVETGSPATVVRTQDIVWDGGGRLKSNTDSVSGKITYTYDDRFNTIATETTPQGTVTYTRYVNGLLESMTPTGGTTVTYHYDDANRLEMLTQAAGTTSAEPSSVLNVSYTYDDANRRKTLTLPNGVKLTYGWDDDSHIASLAWAQSDSTPIGDLSYTYNNIGQRINIGGSLARSGLPPAENLLVGADGRLSTENGNPLSYDLNGRLKQDSQYQYNWNEMGRLSSITINSNVLASFKYDALGRRIEKTTSQGTIKYLYAGNNPVELQDGNGTAVESLLSGGLDQWLARTRGGQTQSFMTDALGSTVRLTDENGNKVVDYAYDPYGGTASDDSSDTNVFQYTGRENDGNGLYYYRNRYIKTSWGRFISQDPTGLNGGPNLYAYVNDDPIDEMDPFGLFSAGGGLSFSWMSGGAGGEISAGLAGDSQGHFCVETSICGRIGAGGEAGMSGYVEGSPNDICTGTSVSGGAFVEAGDGIIAGASGEGGTEGGGGSVTIGGGGGFAAGTETCIKSRHCMW